MGAHDHILGDTYWPGHGPRPILAPKNAIVALVQTVDRDAPASDASDDGAALVAKLGKLRLKIAREEIDAERRAEDLAKDRAKRARRASQLAAIGIAIVAAVVVAVVVTRRLRRK